MTDAAREYAEALEAYNAALVRLREARRHFDPKKTPEAIARTRAMAAANRAEKRAARQAAWPAIKAEREREMQASENRAQAAIEQRENMPNALRILTRVGDRWG